MSNTQKTALELFLNETTDIAVEGGTETRTLIMSKLTNQDLLDTLLVSNVIGCIRDFYPGGEHALWTMLQDLKDKAVTR